MSGSIKRFNPGSRPGYYRQYRINPDPLDARIRNPRRGGGHAGQGRGHGGGPAPFFDSVQEAVEQDGAPMLRSFFVPAPFVLDAFYETADAGVKFIVVVPEHVPVS